MALSDIRELSNEAVSTKSGVKQGDSTGGQTAEGNAGWANSIAKILNTTKPKTKKTLVLSRAKKIKLNNQTNATTSEDYGFEIEGAEEMPEKKFKIDELDDKLKLRTNVHLDLRMKPSWKDIEREKILKKVATKGVVQLFNAVRIQQKELQRNLDAAGPLDSRKEAVLNNINKRKFLDVLMSGSRSKSEAVDNPVKTELKKEEHDSDADGSDSDRKSEWDVLQEDYMTNKKIHWDEESDANSILESLGDSNNDD